VTTVTLDTNVFPSAELIARARRLGIAAAAVTVSHREVTGSSLEEEVRALEALLEMAVWGESRWNDGAWTSPSDSGRFEFALSVISNSSFPPPRRRDLLSDGQRRQLRDAMILCTHVRSSRDVLVSNDVRAFIANGRREAIEREFGTRVMTVEEFEACLLEREQHIPA
jgi:hypothetical protein